MEHLIEMEKKNGHTDFGSFRFCMDALQCGKNHYPSRIFVDHVLIEDGFAYGTDSKRLHRAKLVGEYRNGIYRVFVKLKNHICLVHEFEKDENNYPDLTAVIGYGPLKTLFNAYFGPGADYIRGLTRIIRSLPDKKMVRPEFLSCFDDHFDVKIKEDQIILENKTKLAIVMAMHND